MNGPEIIARTISARHAQDKFGNPYHYHSRSDHHSKVACWAILFDLLQQCRALREHAAAGAIGFGINHEMRDFRTNRKKDLDLVICTPREELGDRTETLVSMIDKYGISLTEEEGEILRSLPILRRTNVGSVRMALEAKAAMTEHGKAAPRLHDELDSSHSMVHGAAENAIAVGLVMINAADSFVSPGLNRHDSSERAPTVTTHRQPKAAEIVLKKILEIRRRERIQDIGFDALGAILVDLKNDRTGMTIVQEGFPEVLPGALLSYDSMIHRIAQLYPSRFRGA